MRIHIDLLKTADDSDKDSKGDQQQPTGPPNLRESQFPGPACISCKYYQNVLGQCQKYGTRTLPMQVCDDWEGGTAPTGSPGSDLASFAPKVAAIRQKLAASLGAPALGGSSAAPLKPITPIGGGAAGGAQPKPPLAGQPNFQGMQPQNQAWRPSAVAGVAAQKGDPNAWIMNLFKPQQQQQPQVKTGSVLNDMFANHVLKQSRLSLPLQNAPVMTPAKGISKLSAVHATGDPLPKDWNHTAVEPTKINGGLRSEGREAWNSIDHIRPSKADQNTFDRAWHTDKGRT